MVLPVSSERPTVEALRSLWKTRHGGRPAPLVLVVPHGASVAVCGPEGPVPAVAHDLPIATVERICRAALDEPTPHAALRFLDATLPEAQSPTPGLRNERLFATHELQVGVPRRPDWEAAKAEAARVGARTGRDLLRALGFEVSDLQGPASLLRARGAGTAVALFLERGESPDVSHTRFGGASPVAYGLRKADEYHVPWLVVSAGASLRLHPVRPGVGVGGRGRTETFAEVRLDLLREDQCAYLYLLFSAAALAPNGIVDQIMEKSARFAADLGKRLRDRVYFHALPRLAEGIARARHLRDPDARALDETYRMALTVLFRPSSSRTRRTGTSSRTTTRDTARTR